MRRAPFLLSLTIGLALAGCKPAQPDYRIVSVPPLRSGVDAWPSLSPGITPAAWRINAALAAANQRMVLALKDCDGDYSAGLAAMGRDAAGQDPVSKDVSRSVTVTMSGKRFLSLSAADDIFCGGAHPDTEQTILMFDLTTGNQVDWTKLVAPTAGATDYVDTNMSGESVHALVLPALQAPYVAAADPDCHDAFTAPPSFQLWPDAAQGVLVAAAFDLPFVVAACAEPMNLSLDQARRLGFSPALLEDIAEAHRASRNTTVISKPSGN